MNQSQTSAWTASSYLFPEPALLNRSSAELRGVIAEHLPGALAMVDDFNGTTDASIDYAQDIIEQARDILIERGESFTDEEKQRMKFLRWSLAHSK